MMTRRSLARGRASHWDTSWMVLDHQQLPLTNNAAERALHDFKTLNTKIKCTLHPLHTRHVVPTNRHGGLEILPLCVRPWICPLKKRPCNCINRAIF